MSAKIKNIIIFVGIGLVLIVLYIVFFGKKTEDPNLVTSSTTQQSSTSTALPAENSGIAKQFLAELLSIKSLELDDTILTGSVFASLRDPDVSITQDEQEGRPNPFAPIGSGLTAPFVGSTPPNLINPVSPINTGSTTAPSTVPGTTPTTPTTPIPPATSTPTTGASSGVSTSTPPPSTPTTPVKTPKN